MIDHSPDIPTLAIVLGLMASGGGALVIYLIVRDLIKGKRGRK